MAVFARVRTARRAHKCDRCLRRIEPGERYRAYSIAPDSDIGNSGWMSGREHLSPSCVLEEDTQVDPYEDGAHGGDLPGSQAVSG